MIGQRNSRQREAVLKVVQESCDHPAAEVVYQRVRAIAPNVSLGTVYRNLSQLSDAGKVRRVGVPGTSGRFDKTLRVHAHFYCRECHAVTDVDDAAIAGLEAAVANAEGHVVESTELLFTGICATCVKHHSEEGNA